MLPLAPAARNLQLFCSRAVFLMWSLAQRTSHFAISFKIVFQEHPFCTIAQTLPRFLPRTWSKCKTTISDSPQSIQGWTRKYSLILSLFSLTTLFLRELADRFCTSLFS